LVAYIGFLYGKKPKICPKKVKKVTPHHQKNVTFPFQTPAQNVPYYPKSSYILPLKIDTKLTKNRHKMDKKPTQGGKKSSF